MDWKAFAESLPQKPPKGVDLRIPHQGMPNNVQKLLARRGYVPTDIRFLEGEDAVLLTIKAGMLGTVQIDQTKVQALRLAATVHGLTDKDRKRTSNETTFRDLDSLLKDLSTTATAPGANAPSGPKGRGHLPGGKPQRTDREPDELTGFGPGVEEALNSLGPSLLGTSPGTLTRDKTKEDE